MSERWLLLGLGNPGPQYAKTRHNAGFWFIDELDQRHRLDLRKDKKFHGECARAKLAGVEIVCLKPETFMNDSGRAARAITDYFQIPIEQVLVAYDDLDLPPGAVRLRRGGGHGGHNGLRSLFAHLPGPGFWRLRLGIGHPGVREAVTPWVLGRPAAEDDALIWAAIRRAAEVLPDLLQGRSERAMQALHTAAGDARETD
ncbi:MAG: aminoacyl-tRNA hydrolase [Wenzhouxiangella sp.]